MTDIGPNEQLLETSARWSGAGVPLADEARSFMASSDGSALLGEDEYRRQVVASIPLLRSFARGLCGDATMGDDLAQDTLLKAWRYRAQFTLGTNLKGWLLKIARNHFYSQRRRLWREAPLDLANDVLAPAIGGGQVQSLLLNDLRNALNTLSDEQREAVILIGAGGFSHREAARMCDVPEGTMKSRVCRARAKLAALLEHGEVESDAEPASLAAHLIMTELSTLAEARAG
jgi:RNA polymerase sigma-70 factor (ECF subfamily)